MRLLVVTARYPTPDRPAAGRFVQERLADPNLSSVVVAPRRYDSPGWLRYLSLAWHAMTARGRFDGVEGHFVLPSGVVALAAARIRGLPLVVYAHGGDVREMAHRNVLYRFLARLVLGSADAVVTNSAETAGIVRVLGARAEVNPPGVNIERFHPTSRPATRRVLYLGGDIPHKGVAVARRLADTLVGPGLNEIPPEQVPDLIAEHDVVLVPSTAEPYGLVAAEAIASGRWVVARAVGGLREIVIDGANGSLVNADADFAGAVAAVPDYDPQAVAATAARFSIETHWAGMAAIWDEVLEAGGRATTGRRAGSDPGAT
jgi:glycosyltransferase involved in cell wall biosynthesis